MTFAELTANERWRPIPHCPGRCVLSSGPSQVSPADLVAVTADVTEHVVSTAKDPVIVVPLDEGGLISYRKRDGRYIHTLNTREGFARKLRQLGIP